ncbi:hypothetical protein N1851_005035 [Merluccius polli]|uniref:Uncharacterized protein n=1 Tax=Merluccius polli TaxID=89951 RepID=A0AA47P745_MERPO|nr:hypothetical protein N1851_005035 [Merluccius polli]
MGDELVVKGALYCIAGDNLGSHAIGGFTENFSSSEYFCRYCLISRTELQGADPNICGLERTPETYSSATEQLETEDSPQVQGIKFRLIHSNSSPGMFPSSVSPFLSVLSHSLTSIIHSYIITLRKLLSTCAKLDRQFSDTMAEAL